MLPPPSSLGVSHINVARALLPCGPKTTLHLYVCVVCCVCAPRLRAALRRSSTARFFLSHTSPCPFLLLLRRALWERRLFVRCVTLLPFKPPPTSTNTLRQRSLLWAASRPHIQTLYSSLCVSPFVCCLSRRVLFSRRVLLFCARPRARPKLVPLRRRERAYALLFCLLRARRRPGLISFFFESLRADTFGGEKLAKNAAADPFLSHTRVVKRQFLSLFSLEISSRQHAAATVALRMGGGTARQDQHPECHTSSRHSRRRPPRSAHTCPWRARRTARSSPAARARCWVGGCVSGDSAGKSWAGRPFEPALW